jgi:hypothetical protein
MSENNHLSFLSPIRGSLQPTLLNLELSFPGRLFWKFALLEQYTVGDTELAELREKGWEPIEDFLENPLVLRLTSQLCLVLALTQQGTQRKAMLWARSADLQQARQFPVVLTCSPSESSNETEQKMVVGTHAILFENSTVYCYELHQLGEAGLHCWQRIAEGLQPHSWQDAQTLEEKMHLSNTLFTQAQEAALHLSKLYWQLHKEKKQSALVASHVTSRTLPSSPSILKSGGIIIPQLDPVEGVLIALSHAQTEKGGWKEINAVPTYVHERPTSTTEVTVRPVSIQVMAGDITRQLWQRVRQFNDVDGDILLAMLAQYLGSLPDEAGGTWITTHQILEYRGIQPKTHKREHPKKGEQTHRQAGHRIEDMQEIADGINRIRDTHITVRTWKESHKKKTSKRPTRKRVYRQESYLVTISDYIQQSQLVLEEEQPSPDDGLAVAWYYRPGNCLDAFLTGPNYRAAWLLQQALQYDPYHERWEKRLARYFTFQMRLNTEFGGTIIRRSIGSLIDELALSLNTNDPSKVKARFDKAMHRLEQDGIISSWGPMDRYEEAMKQRPRYNWLAGWLDYEIEIAADPLSEVEAQSMREHLQVQRRQRRLLTQENDMSENNSLQG